MPRPLRAIFFDIDDTLFSTSEFASHARGAAVDAMRALGLDYPREYLLRELEEVVAEFSTNYGHHFDKLLLRIPATAYAGINPAILIAAGVVAYHQTKFTELQAFPDVREVLRRLAATHLVRGIITAGWEVKQAEKLVRLDLYRWLTPYAIFISDQIGISKPNAKLYLRACSELGLDPQETIYVGDNPTHDVDPPRAIGMKAVLSRRGGKYKDAQIVQQPDYQITNFYQLADILAKDFDIELPEGRAEAVAARPAPGGDH